MLDTEMLEQKRSNNNDCPAVSLDSTRSIGLLLDDLTNNQGCKNMVNKTPASGICEAGRGPRLKPRA
jgi:hypothetical protein